MRATFGVIIVVAGVVGLAVACGRGDRAAKHRDAPAPTVVVDAAAAAPAIDAGLREHMDDHFGAVVRLQQALMRGDLDGVRAEARTLAAHAGAAEPAEWRPFVDAMTVAAKQVADAPDLVAAAGVAANLGLQCRRCHTAQSAIVSFAWEPVPASDASWPSRMKRHAWAAGRLWEGLVGPSDELWQLGAQVMMSTELQALVTAAPAANHDVADLIARIQVLAREALTADTPEAEAAVHGNLMATCVRCHQELRDDASPGSPP